MKPYLRAARPRNTARRISLRSRGRIAERRVPFILSAPPNAGYAARGAKGGLNSYQIFDYAINGTA